MITQREDNEGFLPMDVEQELLVLCMHALAAAGTLLPKKRADHLGGCVVALEMS